MTLNRLVVSMLSSVALGLLLCSVASAQDEGPPPRGDGPPRPEVGRRPPGPPPGRGMGKGRQFGPRSGRGPGQPGDFRPRGPRESRPPGPPHGGPFRWPHHDWEKADPEMYKLIKGDHDLDRQARDLSAKYRRAKDEERSAIKEQLVETVNKHFEIRQQRRQLQLKRLEEELKRLRQAIEDRDKAREALVGKRVSELTGEKKVDF